MRKKDVAQLSVTVPKVLRERFYEYCNVRYMTHSAVITQYLRHLVGKNKEK